MFFFSFLVPYPDKEIVDEFAIITSFLFVKISDKLCVSMFLHCCMLTCLLTTCRSLYFAADYSQAAVGLANKNSSHVNSGGSNEEYCKPTVQCIGDQKRDTFNNLCQEPTCDDYFFAELDSKTHTCVYSVGYATFGLLVTVCFVIFDLLSSFIYQRIDSGNPQGINTWDDIATAAGVDGGSSTMLMRTWYGRVGHAWGLTQAQNWIMTVPGNWLMQGVDFLILRILKWGRRPLPQRDL